MKYTRQIKALKATEEKMWKEWNSGKVYYNFSYVACPLCHEFVDYDCKECPFDKFKSKRRSFSHYAGCVILAIRFNSELHSCQFLPFAETRLDHAISFIMQMRMFYEEM